MANYPYDYQQQYQMQPQQYRPQQPLVQNSYTCKPVTSREEAISMPTNFMGLGDIMPDLAHGVIYVKRFNPNTGSSEFGEFVYTPPKTAEPPQEYATVQMLNDALGEIKADIAALNKPVKKKGGTDE